MFVAGTFGHAQAQNTTDSRPLTSTLTATALRNLPSSDSLFSTLETAHAPIVSDRFSTGLSPAESARIGAFLDSWTQTTYHIADVDISSPMGGLPLFVPPAMLWQSVRVTAGLPPADATSAGVRVSLDPEPPSPHWTGGGTIVGSWGDLVSSASSGVPAIARPHDWSHVDLIVSGPIGNRGGVTLAGTSTRSTQYDRGHMAETDAGIDSLVGQVVLGPRERQLQLLGWVQAARSGLSRELPYLDDRSRKRDVSSHLQATWARRTPGRRQWRAFSAFTQRSRELNVVSPAQPTVERVIDGLPASPSGAFPGVERRWSAGFRAEAISGRAAGVLHVVDLGADFKLNSADRDPVGAIQIGELVGGLPARLWTISAAPASHRHTREGSAFIRDQIDLTSRLSVDAAMHVSSVSGRARDAGEGLSWTTWLPRASLRWHFARSWRASAFGSYSRAADVPTLSTVEFGDPAAVVADVRRWTGANVGPLVARTGPGSGPDGLLTRIDPDVSRPVTNEWAAGVELAPGIWPRFRATALRKLATHQLALVNLGVSASDYRVVTLFDPGPNVLDPVDDQLLPIYERLPSAFGRDQYLVTTPEQTAATFKGIAFSVDGTWGRTILLSGLTMGWTHGRAGNRGFGPSENDMGVIGEVFADPNALTHARGNLFTDRQYTVKIAGVQRLPRDFRLGVIARYQDGQAFSRVVIIPDLSQGAEPIRAFRSGKSRFTYTGTLDVRLTKGVAITGGRQLDLFLDAYNIVNMAKEVEEWVVTGPEFRRPTALQPPRAVHLGLRFSM